MSGRFPYPDSRRHDCRDTTPVDFLGMFGVKPSESNAALHIIGGGIDRDYLCDFAMAHENSDFDGVLVGYTSASADGLHVGQAAAACRERIKFLIVHRPGIVTPNLAACKVATLDFFARRRVSFHIITGGHETVRQFVGAVRAEKLNASSSG